MESRAWQGILRRNLTFPENSVILFISPKKEANMSHHHHHDHAHTSAARILVAFLLNLCFSAFELIGGLFTGSVAILSDALHDLGDAPKIFQAQL